MERMIDGVRYRMVPESDFWIAGDNGTFWKGELGGKKSDWKTVNLHPKGKLRILFVSIGEGPFLVRRRAAEKILVTFGKHKPRYENYIGYRDGNTQNLRLENLFWTGDKHKVIPRTWGKETQVEMNHASQDHRTANPPHHLPD